MLVQELILKKRNNYELTEEEIFWFVNAVCTGAIDDSQIAAFLMSVWFNKMTEKERVVLTQAMMKSGDVIEWSLPGPVVDKHSTGGVGDSVSLILAPIMASLGCYIPMISGKGLGHTGGTLDKLSSIPGFEIIQTEENFKKIVAEVGCAIVGQSASLAPADKILYSIRDVTATIDSIDLITASILSKKLAGGIRNLILDVKVGNGSFMETFEEAETLSDSLVSVSTSAGCNAAALLTRMDQPLNSCVGNALEVEKSIEVMTGSACDSRLLETTIGLSLKLYLLAYPEEDPLDVREKINTLLSSGYVAERFERMVASQGGQKNILMSYKKCLPKKEIRVPVFSSKEGFINSIDTKRLGILLIKLGGGRKIPSDIIDYGVGFSQICSINNFIDKKTPLLLMHVDTEEVALEMSKDIQECFLISDKIENYKENFYSKRAE